MDLKKLKALVNHIKKETAFLDKSYDGKMTKFNDYGPYLSKLIHCLVEKVLNEKMRELDLSGNEGWDDFPEGGKKISKEF